MSKYVPPLKPGLGSPDLYRYMHVIPLNDDMEHKLSHTCDCSPYVDLDDGLVIHHAKDFREKKERGGNINPEKKWAVMESKGKQCVK